MVPMIVGGGYKQNIMAHSITAPKYSAPSV